MSRQEVGTGRCPFSLPVFEELLEDGTLVALGQNLHLSVWGAPHVGDKVLHHLQGHLPLLVSFSPLLDVDLATEPTVQHIVSHQILAAQGQRGWSQPPWSGSFVQWHQRPYTEPQPRH